MCAAVMILHLVGATRNIGAHLKLGSVLEEEIGKGFLVVGHTLWDY